MRHGISTALLNESILSIISASTACNFGPFSPETPSIFQIYLSIHVRQETEKCIYEGAKISKTISAIFTNDVSVHAGDTLNRSIQNCPAFV